MDEQMNALVVAQAKASAAVDAARVVVSKAMEAESAAELEFQAAQNALGTHIRKLLTDAREALG